MCKSFTSREGLSNEYILQKSASVQPRTGLSKFAKNEPTRKQVRPNIGDPPPHVRPLPGARDHRGFHAGPEDDAVDVHGAVDGESPWHDHSLHRICLVDCVLLLRCGDLSFV